MLTAPNRRNSWEKARINNKVLLLVAIGQWPALTVGTNLPYSFSITTTAKTSNPPAISNQPAANTMIIHANTYWQESSNPSYNHDPWFLLQFLGCVVVSGGVNEYRWCIHHVQLQSAIKLRLTHFWSFFKCLVPCSYIIIILIWLSQDYPMVRRGLPQFATNMCVHNNFSCCFSPPPRQKGGRSHHNGPCKLQTENWKLNCKMITSTANPCLSSVRHVSSVRPDGRLRSSQPDVVKYVFTFKMMYVKAT